MVAVKLKVAGTHWRTWSSKRIDPSRTGNWRVDIKDSEDRKISSIGFSVGDDVKKIEENRNVPAVPENNKNQLPPQKAK